MRCELDFDAWKDCMATTQAHEFDAGDRALQFGSAA
jgi:hypothetical protein